MRNDYDGTNRPCLQEHLRHQLDGSGVEVGERLVDQNQISAVSQSHGQLEPLKLAARQDRRRPITILRQKKLVDELIHSGRDRSRSSEKAPSSLPESLRLPTMLARRSRGQSCSRMHSGVGRRGIRASVRFRPLLLRRARNHRCSPTRMSCRYRYCQRAREGHRGAVRS
jgi:hypothetical protein